MNNVNYFTGLFESIPDYKKIVFLFFFSNHVNFLYDGGFLNGDINVLYREIRNILLELNEENLDHI